MSELQKTSDIIIGKAAKMLLEADQEVCFDSLLRVISEAYQSLQDESLKPAYRRALSDIRRHRAEAEHSQAEEGDDHSRSLNRTLPGPSDSTH